MRCYLVGNGPSLSPDFLDSIEGEYSFATNAIGCIYPKTRWRPSHYIMVSTNFWIADRKPDYEASAREAGSVIADTEFFGQIDGIDEFVRVRRFPDTRQWHPDWWSDHPDQWVSAYGTTLLVGAQIAAKDKCDIVFVGCDGYDSGIHNKEYPSWGDDFDIGVYSKTLLGAHELMSYHFKRLGMSAEFVGKSQFASLYV